MYAERIIRFIIEIVKEAKEYGYTKRLDEFKDIIGMANGLAVEGMEDVPPESVGMSINYVDNSAKKDFVMQLAVEYVKGVLQATGAVETPKDNENQNRQQAPPADAPKPDPVADLLKELGVESLDSLKERLKKPEAPPADLTPEEKARQDEAYKADLINYAVKNGNMKVEDFNKLDALKAKADADLVFEQHLKEFKRITPI
ncbi:unnamed protein product [Sphagnum jensenii]|uniref:Uncharacterized protein n=1 Tax=Sphagnum jensenii TaxID=128206 RepID=A0ABP0V876_9BRYO